MEQLEFDATFLDGSSAAGRAGRLICSSGELCFTPECGSEAVAFPLSAVSELRAVNGKLCLIALAGRRTVQLRVSQQAGWERLIEEFSTRRSSGLAGWLKEVLPLPARIGLLVILISFSSLLLLLLQAAGILH